MTLRDSLWLYTIAMAIGCFATALLVSKFDTWFLPVHFPHIPRAGEPLIVSAWRASYGWIMALPAVWLLATFWLIFRRKPITAETMIVFAAVTTLALVFLAAFSALAVAAVFASSDHFLARPLAE